MAVTDAASILEVRGVRFLKGRACIEYARLLGIILGALPSEGFLV